MFFFPCSIFLIVSQVTADSPTTHRMVVCSGVITMTFAFVPAAVNLPVSYQHDVYTAVDIEEWGQHDVALSPQLILRETMRASIFLATVLPKQQPQSHMPSKAYANFALGPPQVNFLFQTRTSHDFLMLLSVMVFAFCFQVPMWLLWTPMGIQPLGFATQPYGIYP